VAISEITPLVVYQRFHGNFGEHAFCLEYQGSLGRKPILNRFDQKIVK